MSNVLITGGAGYIGSALTRELLAKGHHVTVADAMLFGGEALIDLGSLPSFKVHKVDITDTGRLETLLTGSAFDAVVHRPPSSATACRKRSQGRPRTSGKSKGLFDYVQTNQCAPAPFPLPAATTAKWPKTSYSPKTPLFAQ